MIAFLLTGIVLGGWILLWALVGQPWRSGGGGVLWTTRALMVGFAFALIGALGFRVVWALDAMLLANVALIGLIWLDATLAPRLAAARAPGLADERPDQDPTAEHDAGEEKGNHAVRPLGLRSGREWP